MPEGELPRSQRKHRRRQPFPRPTLPLPRPSTPLASRLTPDPVTWSLGAVLQTLTVRNSDPYGRQVRDRTPQRGGSGPQAGLQAQPEPPPV